MQAPVRGACGSLAEQLIPLVLSFGPGFDGISTSEYHLIPQREETSVSNSEVEPGVPGAPQRPRELCSAVSATLLWGESRE